MNTVSHLLPEVPAMSNRRMLQSQLVRALLIDTKYEFVRIFRSPTFLIPVLLIPPIVYALFGVAFINSFDYDNVVDFTRMDLLKLMFVNLSVFSILGPTMVSLGTFMALERESGLLTFRRALPMPAYAPLLAKSLFAMLSILALMAILTVEAIVFAGLELSFMSYAGIWLVCIFGSLPFAAMGLYLGVRLSGSSANGVVQGVYMGMAMIGGLLFPLPDGFAWVALFSPAFYLSQLGFSVAGMEAAFSPYLPVSLLGGITVLFGWLATRRILRGG